ncbi:MAG TPA: S53 family peptidase, partial [Solirubrobacteraceae bacterium]
MADVPADYVALEGSERHPSPDAEIVGPADPSEKFSVTIVLRRRPDGPAVPDFSYYARTPRAQRPRLSREDFAAKYGAAPDDLAKVTDFVTSHGLEVVETDPARRTVVASGTVAQMSEAFAVELQHYEHEVTPRAEQDPVKETYRGRDGVIHVPSELAPIVIGVFGLDNRRVIKRNSGDPPNTAPLSAATIAKLYNFPTNSAAGQTIAIFSEAGYVASDISASFGGHPPTVTSITVDASNNGSADAETTQDICIAAAVAPGAHIAVYFTTYSQQGWVDLVHRVVHPNAGDPSCLVLSSSFYVTNGDDAATLAAEGVSSSWLTAASQAFEDAAIQGVTVCIASGDTGAQSKKSDGKAHVQYPASDPWVLAVGGTTIGNVNGSSFTEYVWNDNTGASGGGISYTFGVPGYQDGAGVPASVNSDHHVGRGVPDVAGNASPNAAYSGIVVGGRSFGGNGTSASSPLWAGLVAVINAALGEPVGFLNPEIYEMGSPVFRDIVGAPGPANNSFSGVTGYPVQAGWDAATGWGSPNGQALLQALRGVGLPPALAEFDGKLYMAWKGVERDDRVFFSSFNGTSWAAQAQVPGIGSSTGVSLAVFDGKLYMAWKGILDDDRIFYSSFNGTSWAPQTLITGVGTSVGPELAVFDGKLYMIWKGELTDERIFYSSFNGTSWAPQILIGGVGTSVGPSLAVFDGALYAAWKGIETDEGIYYSHFNGSTWAAQQRIAGVGTSQGPSLSVFGTALYAAWKGIDGDQGIYYSDFTGSTWAPQRSVAGVGTSQGPGLAESGGKLYMAWKGVAGDERL